MFLGSPLERQEETTGSAVAPVVLSAVVLLFAVWAICKAPGCSGGEQEGTSAFCLFSYLWFYLFTSSSALFSPTSQDQR